MGDAELRQGAADLGGLALVDLAARLRGMEIVRAAIGVEGAEEALRGDRLEQPEEARHRPFLLDQEGRVDRARRIVEGDDEIELLLDPGEPAMGRAVLEEQHARQRPALAPLAMHAAALRRAHQPGGVQRQPGHRVAQLVAVPLDEMLVEVLHVHAAVALLVETLHARQLGRRRPLRRGLADPQVAQPLDAILLVAGHQAAEVPPRHAQQLPGLLARQAPLPVTLKRIFEPAHIDLP